MYSFIQYTQKDVGRRLYKENGDLQYFSDHFPQHILLTEAEPTCCLLHQSLLGARCQKCPAMLHAFCTDGNTRFLIN